MRLPKLPNGDRRRRQQEIAFGGVNYSENFKEGQWEETRNISCALFPSLIPRAGRRIVSQEDGATAIYVFDKLAKVVGTGFYWDGVYKGEVSPGKKQFAKVGDVLCIFPDGAFYNIADDTFSSHTATITIPFRGNGPRVQPSYPSRLYYTSAAGLDYERVRNGEDLTGRGNVGDVNPKVYLTPDPLDIEDKRPVYFNEVQQYIRLGWKIYPFPDDQNTQTDESAISYDILGAQCEECVYWPQDGDLPEVKRWYWTISYGVKEGQWPREKKTVYGTIGGWEYDKDTEKYTENIVKYNNKYLNELLIGDTVETDGDEKTVVEYINREWYKDHYYYPQIRTGVYEGTEGEAIDIDALLASAQISPGTKVRVSQGDASADTVYSGKGDGYLAFLNSLEALEDKLGPVTIKNREEGIDFDFITASGNRLWGVKGDTIFASAWGDPMEFDETQGIAADPWQAQVGSDGDWTGIVEYSGTVLCFKEDMLHIVMGTLPENYRVYDYNVAGVKKGCAESAVIINEVLYYYGIEGVYRYSGNTPTLISQNFGLREYENAAAGTDGIRYYLSAQRDETSELFTYDTVKGIWLREDELKAEQFARYEGKLYALDGEGKLIMLGDGESRSADTDIDGNRSLFVWSMKSVPFYEDSFNRKYHSKLIIRMELFPFSSFTVSVSYDGGEDIQIFQSDIATGHRVIIVPVLPRRCDAFRLKLEGAGNFILRGIAREYSEGREY